MSTAGESEQQRVCLVNRAAARAALASMTNAELLSVFEETASPLSSERAIFVEDATVELAMRVRLALQQQGQAALALLERNVPQNLLDSESAAKRFGGDVIKSLLGVDVVKKTPPPPPENGQQMSSRKKKLLRETLIRETLKLSAATAYLASDLPMPEN
jgi:hypothetical protein